MAKLLVSVRSAAEAEAALEGGADIIDVKEPLHGSLGCAMRSVILEVLQKLRGRIPTSAALGELTDCLENSPALMLDFVKWGLAGADRDWQNRLLEVASPWVSNGRCQPVAVVYADWRQACSPPPAEVFDFVRKNRWKVLLLDTFQKDGRTLLDWMPYDETDEICRCCKQEGILIALAGSLASREISLLLPLQPDVFAVRGAVCCGRDRMASVDSRLVQRVANLLGSTRLESRLIDKVSLPGQTWETIHTAANAD